MPSPEEKANTVKVLARQIGTGLKARKASLPKIEEEYSKERGKRTAQYVSYRDRLIKQGMSPREATEKAQAKLGGQLLKKEPAFAQVDLTPQQWNGLEQTILEKYPTPDVAYQQKRASDALNKIKNGQKLQKNEIELLAEVFGIDFYKALRPTLSFHVRALELLIDVGGFLKTITAGGDVSFGGRQTFPVLWKDVGRLLTSGKVETRWARTFGRQVAAFFLEKKYQKYDKELRKDPYYKRLKKIGVEFTDITLWTGQAGRPEQFPSRAAEKYWPLIHRGNRAASTAGNTARWLVGKSILEEANRKGIVLSTKQEQKLATYLNDLTGRSTISRKSAAIRGLTDLANIVAFAPRHALSRIKNVATLFHTISKDPIIRREGIETLVGFSAFMFATGGLAKMFGVPMELNPHSADFLKIRKGKLHIDLTAGHAAVMRFFARLFYPSLEGGRVKTAAGEIKTVPRSELIKQFLETKRSSLMALIIKLYTGRGFAGKKVQWTTEGITDLAIETMIYLWVQDAIEAYKNDDLAQGVIAGFGSWIGLGVSSYPERPGTTLVKRQNEVAYQHYGKGFDELSSIDQKALRASYPDLEEKELTVKQERFHEEEIQFGERAKLEQEKVRQRMFRALPEDVREELDRLKFTLPSIGRRMGEWYLNDPRYKLYEDTVTRILKDELPSKLAEWEGSTDKQKRVLLEDYVTTLTKVTRKELDKIARRGKI
mgnify:CR=1 FL=1